MSGNASFLQRLNAQSKELAELKDKKDHAAESYAHAHPQHAVGTPQPASTANVVAGNQLHYPQNIKSLPVVAVPFVPNPMFEVGPTQHISFVAFNAWNATKGRNVLAFVEADQIDAMMGSTRAGFSNGLFPDIGQRPAVPYNQATASFVPQFSQNSYDNLPGEMNSGPHAPTSSVTVDNRWCWGHLDAHGEVFVVYTARNPSGWTNVSFLQALGWVAEVQSSHLNRFGSGVHYSIAPI